MSVHARRCIGMVVEAGPFPGVLIAVFRQVAEVARFHVVRVHEVIAAAGAAGAFELARDGAP